MTSSNIADHRCQLDEQKHKIARLMQKLDDLKNIIEEQKDMINEQKDIINEQKAAIDELRSQVAASTTFAFPFETTVPSPAESTIASSVASTAATTAGTSASSSSGSDTDFNDDMVEIEQRLLADLARHSHGGVSASLALLASRELDSHDWTVQELDAYLHWKRAEIDG